MANTSESEPALFPAKKGQKPPPIFHTKKLIPLSFLLYFYVVIFPMPTQNLLIIIVFQDLSSRLAKMAQNLPAPRIFSRHTKVPNRQKPANPPLLATLRTPNARFDLGNRKHEIFERVIRLDILVDFHVLLGIY